MSDDFEDITPLRGEGKKLTVIDGGAAKGRKKRGPKPESRLPDDVLTEDAIALMFTAEHGQRARYDHDTGFWLIWDPDLLYWRRVTLPPPPNPV